MNTSSDALLQSRLDVLVRLIAVQLIESKETFADKIEVLDRAGLTPREIAHLCGSTPNSVSVGLHRVRKGKKRSARNNAKKT